MRGVPGQPVVREAEEELRERTEHIVGKAVMKFAHPDNHIAPLAAHSYSLSDKLNRIVLRLHQDYKVADRVLEPRLARDIIRAVVGELQVPDAGHGLEEGLHQLLGIALR